MIQFDERAYFFSNGLVKNHQLYRWNYTIPSLKLANLAPFQMDDFVGRWWNFLWILEKKSRLAKSLHVDVNLWREGISGDQVGELMDFLTLLQVVVFGLWVKRVPKKTPNQKQGIWSTKGWGNLSPKCSILRCRYQIFKWCFRISSKDSNVRRCDVIYWTVLSGKQHVNDL